MTPTPDRSSLLATAATFLLVAGSFASCLAQQPSEEVEPASGVFVPVPRELIRPFQRAREAIQREDYREAVELLGQILTDPSNEDFLVQLPDHPHTAVSLRRECQAMLGRVPSRFRESYELKYGTQARQLLDLAIEQSDFDLLAQVTRRYFHTEAGYLAMMLLGHHHLESGQPVSAVACFEQVVSSPQGRAAHDPEASVLLATSWLLTAAPERARQVLVALRQRTPQRTISFQGTEVPWFAEQDDALQWLTGLIGQTPLRSLPAVDHWILYRGNPQRNAQSGTGFPLPFPRWYVPTINDPDHELIAKEILGEMVHSGRASIPSGQPLGVSNAIIMRSMERMIGIDFETGKRIWEFPPWAHDSLLTDEDDQVQRYRKQNTSQRHVLQRMWMDHTFGQISSDGNLVFVIDQPGFATSEMSAMVVNQGIVIADPLGQRVFNELKAVELARQGAFRWEVGGESGGDEPQLARSFFLGAPLPIGDQLYALCEQEGEIRLVALDTASGRLNWTQQIANVEANGPVQQDQTRRLAAATPSYSDGILVCPTTAAAIVAVDLSSRSLLWGVPYEPASREELQPFGRRQTSHPLGDDGQSVDSSVMIADGCVVTMPVDSQKIYCLDLLNGEPLWTGDKQPGIDREDSLFVGCLEDGRAVLIGEESIRGIELRTGKEVWRTRLDAHGKPSGQGYANSGHYFLPTTGSRLVKIRIRDGTIADWVRTERVLGNLICYGGDVISHGVDYVTAYRQDLPSIHRVQRAEQLGEITPEIQILKSQLLAQQGKLLDALKLADAAYQQQPSERNLRLLMDFVLQLLQTDYASAEPLAEKYKAVLIERRRYDFWAAKVEGQLHSERPAEAFDTLLEIAADTSQPLIDPTADHTLFRPDSSGEVILRLDRWVQAKVRQLLEELRGGQRPMSADQVERYLMDTAASASPEELSRLVELFGATQLSGEYQLRLVDWLMQQGRWLDAEVALQPLIQQAPSAVSATAEATLARLFIEAGWASQAMEQIAHLRSVYADVAGLDGRTGSEAAEHLMNQIPHDAALGTSRDFPYGSINSQVVENDLDGPVSYALVNRFECRQLSGSYPPGIVVTYNPQRWELVVNDAMGAVLARVSMQPQQASQRFYIPYHVSGTYVLSGHLLIANYGFELVAIDLFQARQTGDGRLWHISLQPEFDAQGFGLQSYRAGFSYKMTTNAWGESLYRLMDPNGRPVGGFAVSGHRNVLLARHNQLVCVDALSGEKVWQRGGIEPGSELMADDRSVVVIPPDRPGAAEYSPFDGRHLSVANWEEGDGAPWAGIGPRVLLAAKDAEAQSLRVFDAQAEEMSWAREYPLGSKAQWLAEGRLAVYQPDGQFELLNVRDGSVVFQCRLMPSSGFQAMEVRPLRDSYLIVLNRQRVRSSLVTASAFNVQIRPVNYVEGLVDGFVYCVDRHRGAFRWKSPLRVEQFWIPHQQPFDVPVLTLMRTVQPQAGRDRRLKTQIFCVDLRDGRVVLNQPHLPFVVRSYEISGSLSDQSLDVNVGQQTMRLRFSEQDLSPPIPGRLDHRRTLQPLLAQAQMEERELDNLQNAQQQALEGLKRIQGERKDEDRK